MPAQPARLSEADAVTAGAAGIARCRRSVARSAVPVAVEGTERAVPANRHSPLPQWPLRRGPHHRDAQ